MKKWLIGVIVGVVLVALIIGGAIIYLSKPKIKWKTYESKEWGFRVKYPADWEIWEEGIRTVGKEDFFISFVVLLNLHMVALSLT
jgi:hypothetical protein